MKGFRLAILLLLGTMFMAPVFAASSAKGWDSVNSEIKDAKTIVKEAEFEILTSPSCIIVSSNQPVQIKVFTILGRLVSEATLPAGTSRFNIGAHGVYIVKVGDLTCKVAI